LTGGTHTLTEITGAVTDLMMERLGGERFDFVDAAWYENGGIPASLVPAAQGDRIPCSLRQITVRDYADGTQGVELTYGVTLRGIPVTPYRAQMIPDTGMEGASVTVRVERWGYVDAYRTDCAGLPASEVQLTHPAGKDYMEGSELLSLEEACRIADDHLTDPKTAYRVRLQYAILALKTNDVIQGRVLTPVWQFEFFHEDPYTFQLTPRESGGYVLDVDALTGEVYGWLAQ
ncbi:MAG: hypothetical protein IJ055_10590, partial [Oscillospiraceae bacterium]|nr:hypothetical protein [Oscillospiraceae bacterium]